jgi:hypothetical protein
MVFQIRLSRRTTTSTYAIRKCATNGRTGMESTQDLNGFDGGAREFRGNVVGDAGKTHYLDLQLRPAAWARSRSARLKFCRPSTSARRATVRLTRRHARPADCGSQSG